MRARMAARLLQEHQVADLCIGKPALRWLPPSSTLADAIADLEAGGRDDAAVAVWDGAEGSGVAGRLCMADALLFLCADDAGLASPAAALQATLSDLSAAGALRPVRRMEPDASVVDAVDSFLDGAHTLVVPIRERWRWRRAADRCNLCWLTLEDVVRFLLSSVGLFSATASRSVSDLGVVRAATLAVAAGDSALSAVPLLRAALASHASVAVVTDPLARVLVGEISPSALCSCDVSAAAAIAALSAAQLLSFMDWGSAPPVAALHAVRSRLRRRNLLGMLDLLYGSDASSSSSSSAASSSSSSDEDEDVVVDENNFMASPCAGRGKHCSLFSARVSGRRRREEEAIVCHRGSSLVAVMVQAMVHRATHVWVVEGQELVGVVGLLDVLRVLRQHLVHRPPV